MRVVLLAVVAAFVGLACGGSDYYSRLGVDRHADDKTIKKAYYKLAQKYHPDKNPDDPKASARFQNIAQAYETLSDPEKRRTYNLHGEEGLNPNRRPPPNPNMQGRRPQGNRGGFPGGFGGDPFGGAGGFGGGF
eukprot:CAMPEP_0182908782 /NCGR_PEP_ID=MMETSP0034_2-20130328/35394_1 /TAXON_ID=156128 /ORGANISM="Nephroselmis pyriformis, Strain CCMP717" /LENGTH=133 /DNA_ID=CAMNT_0025044979 /DNA_START=20 /DNA_END=418 /DNA_ORIENTATION=-